MINLKKFNKKRHNNKSKINQNNKPKIINNTKKRHNQQKRQEIKEKKRENNKYPHKLIKVNYYRDLYDGEYYIRIIYYLI